jgi:hypothetical protein
MTARVLRIEDIGALGRPVVTLTSLRPGGLATESNAVRTQFLSVLEKHKLSLVLVDEQAVNADAGFLCETDQLND